MMNKTTKLQRLQKLHKKIWENTQEINKIVVDIQHQNFKGKVLLCYHSHYRDLKMSVFPLSGYYHTSSSLEFNDAGMCDVKTDTDKKGLSTKKVEQILTALSKPVEE